jgi:hypothetical protein
MGGSLRDALAFAMPKEQSHSDSPSA